MKRSTSNPNRPLRRRSFRGWLKRVTLPGSPKKIGSDMKGNVFGISLTTSIQYAKTSVGYIDDDGVKHSKAGSIPIVAAKCGSYLKQNGLETEGIFRISGSVKRVNELEFQFDSSASHYGLDFNWEGYTVHDTANLFTRYLNKLPNSVIPFESFQAFRDVMSNNAYSDIEKRIDAFQGLIQNLAVPHQHLLLYLLDTLSLFASNAAQTKMSIPNLAAVFCPSILRHPDHNTPLEYKISQYVIEFLIEYQSLFTMQVLDKKNKKLTDELPWSVSHQSLPTLRAINSSIHSERSNNWISSPEENLPPKVRSLQETKQVVEPWIVPMVLLLSSYEAYLIFALHCIVEPLIVFSGLFSYYTLFSIEQPTKKEEGPGEAMRQDELFMSEWRDLMTRSWKRTNEEDSIASKASRYDEEEEEQDDSEEEDGFDPATLEMYLLQYDQIKKDADLAKKLQHEEQKARDVNNPFINEKAADNKEAWKISAV
ncbi:unnamed protein product [Rhizopus stolonifer]